MSRKLYSFVVVIVLAVLAASLTGCGGGGGDSKDTSVGDCPEGEYRNQYGVCVVDIGKKLNDASQQAQQYAEQQKQAAQQATEQLKEQAKRDLTSPKGDGYDGVQRAFEQAGRPAKYPSDCTSKERWDDTTKTCKPF